MGAIQMTQIDIPDEVAEFLEHRQFGTAERKNLANSGKAMSDGSYPITNAKDLQNAIKAVGLGGASKDKIRSHIIKRAQAMKMTNMIPDTWNPDGSLKHFEDVENWIEHHGIKGMHWGVRKDEGGGFVSRAKARIKKEVDERTGEDVVVRTSPGKGVKTVGGNKRAANEDAVKARTSEQIAKRSTLDALSNQELQGLVTRMNLEQQYRNLSVNEDRRSLGEKYVGDLVESYGSTIVDAKFGAYAPMVKSAVSEGVRQHNKATSVGVARKKPVTGKS